MKSRHYQMLVLNYSELNVASNQYGMTQLKTIQKMTEFYSTFTPAEYDWIRSNDLITIDNSGSLEELKEKILNL